MATQKRPTYITPIGTLGWCSIHEPDTKFADEKDPNDLGKFSAKMILPKDEAATKKFIAELEAIYEQAYREECVKQGKKSLKCESDTKPWSDELGEDTEEPTGNVVVRFGLKARVTTKSGKVFDQRPKVFDTANKLVTPVPAIGPGSRARIAGQVSIWYSSKFGMSLWLEGVQLHELVKRGGGRTAEGYGFQEAEGGYTSEGAFQDAVENAEGDEGNGDF